MTRDVTMKKQFIAIFVFVIMVQIKISDCQDEDPDYIKIESELELIQWDLQDECSDMAHDLQSFLFNEPTGLRDKIRSEVDHATFLRTHAQRLRVYKEVPYEMQRNWTYFTKCGDVLLAQNEYKALNVFANKNLDLKYTDRIETIENVKTLGNVKNDSDVIKSLNEQDVLDALATCRNMSQLEDIWMKWQSGTKPFKEWYGDALKLTNNAAVANDCVNVETYWELLTDVPGGYDLSRNLFKATKPLYEKLMNFVRLRLNHHYNTTFEDSIPSYLTGTFMADDWSHIADILLPNPQLYYDIKVELEAREVVDLYKYAGNITKHLGFGDLTNSDFLKRSKFDAASCDPKVLDFCAEQYSSVITCNHTSINDYFNAHEAVMQLGLTKVNFHSYVQQSLRHSAVVDGMVSMSTLLSIDGMVQHNILDKNVFTDDEHRDDNRMTILLLLALRILPKIAYYHAMDEFRLDLLENYGNPEEVFQEHRNKIQGVYANSTDDDTSEYLREEHILYNRPYLSKMLGQYLQFQLLNYYQIDIFENDVTTMFNKDTTFRDFVLNIPNRETEDLLSYYYNIDEIYEYPLVSFFSPLEEYLDNAPMEQAAFKLKKAKYVKHVSTTPAPKVKKPKTKPVSVTKTHVQVNSTKSQANDRKLDMITSGNVAKETKTPNAQTIDTNDNVGKVSGHDVVPVQAKTQIGIYIGAAIVLFTLGIIGGGFVMQRRRTQRNNRRYNA